MLESFSKMLQNEPCLHSGRWKFGVISTEIHQNSLKLGKSVYISLYARE